MKPLAVFSSNISTERCDIGLQLGRFGRASRWAKRRARNDIHIGIVGKNAFKPADQLGFRHARVDRRINLSYQLINQYGRSALVQCKDRARQGAGCKSS